MQWTEVCKEHRCLVCGKTDWCSRSDDGQAFNCKRTTTQTNGFTLVKPAESGAIFRVEDLSQAQPAPVPAPKPKLESSELTAKQQQCLAGGAGMIGTVAASLGLKEESLRKLGCGYIDEDAVSSSGNHYRRQCWTFPEFNGKKEIVGIATRNRDGSKFMLPGSRRGIYIPEGWNTGSGAVYLVEGASDTAAMIELGLSVLGRPSCAGGEFEFAEVHKDFDREIVVLGDRDEVKQDGSLPGQEGCQKTAKELTEMLGREVCWAIMPEGFKDPREFLLAGGSKKLEDFLEVGGIDEVSRLEAEIKRLEETDEFRDTYRGNRERRSAIAKVRKKLKKATKSQESQESPTRRQEKLIQLGLGFDGHQVLPGNWQLIIVRSIKPKYRLIVPAWSLYVQGSAKFGTSFEADEFGTANKFLPAVLEKIPGASVSFSQAEWKEIWEGSAGKPARGNNPGVPSTIGLCSMLIDSAVMSEPRPDEDEVGRFISALLTEFRNAPEASSAKEGNSFLVRVKGETWAPLESMEELGVGLPKDVTFDRVFDLVGFDHFKPGVVGSTRFLRFTDRDIEALRELAGLRVASQARGATPTEEATLFTELELSEGMA